MPFVIAAKVSTPVGIFTGFASGKLPTMERAKEERNLNSVFELSIQESA